MAHRPQPDLSGRGLVAEFAALTRSLQRQLMAAAGFGTQVCGELLP